MLLPKATVQKGYHACPTVACSYMLKQRRAGTQVHARGACNTWPAELAAAGLPQPPMFEGANPRTKFNAVTLAYLGDSVYEALLRRHVVQQAQINSQNQSMDPRALFLASSGQANATRQAHFFDILMTASAPTASGCHPAAASGTSNASGTTLLEVTAMEPAPAAGTAGGAQTAVPASSSTPAPNSKAIDALLAGRGKGFGKPTSTPAPSASPPSRSGRTSQGRQRGNDLALTNAPVAQQKEGSRAAVAAAPQQSGSPSGSTPSSGTGLNPAQQQLMAAAAWLATQGLSPSSEERDVLRWGSNADVTPPKGTEARVYKKATAFEVLVAFLYLTSPTRCLQLVNALLMLRPDSS